MTKRITKLLAALALLVFMMPTMAGWGQTTVDVTLSSGTISNNVITWTCADGNITIQQLKGSGSTNPNGSYINAPRVYKQNILSFVGTNGYTITNIDIKCDGGYYGTTKYAGTEISNNNVENNTAALNPTWSTANGGTHTIATVSSDGLSEIYIQNGHSSDANTQLRITKITITYKVSGSVTATTVTINTSGLTNTDVYTSTTAGTLTASVTETESGDAISGATVTWTSSDTDVATIDNSGAVTLVAVGTTTITASYAGESGVYGASSATYELTVTSSEPYVQPTTIEITPNYTFWGKTGQFSGSTYDELEGSQDNVSLVWTRGTGSTYANSTAMRFYKDNTLVFTAPTGYEIISIELTITGTYSDLTFSPEGFENTAWTGASETVTMSRPSNGSSYAQISKFTITLGLPSTNPSITAENVSINYNATSGSIYATINNYVAGTLAASTEADWISDFTYDQADEIFEVGFTTTANDLAIDRTATVTLTYTYGESQTATKNVTVTQAGNPNVVPTIAEVRAQGTGSVVTKGVVTSCVGTTGYIQDATAAICVYGSSLTVGDEIRVSGTLSTYHGLLEITSPEVTVISQNNTVEPTVKTIAEINADDITSPNSIQGLYVTIEEATVTGIDGSNTTIAQGENTIIVRGISGVEYDVNDVLTLDGNIGCYNVAQIANPQNVEVQAAPAVPSITVSPASVELDAEEANGAMDIIYENLTITGASDFDIQYYNEQGVEINEPDWILAEVNEKVLSKDDAIYEVTYTIEANNGEARTAYFKVFAMDDETNLVYSNLVTINQAAAPQQYTLTVEPFENLELITFVDDEMVMEADSTIQVAEGAHIMLSIVADEGYVMETLMVNGVNHVDDIAVDFTYEFDMPAENVTISATAVEQVVHAGGDYVRITSLNELTDGSIVVIAARYDAEHTNGYYAMSNATSGKPTGVLFTSITSGDNEILPASIVDNEDDYYWVVNETENGFTFTNSEGFMIGYNSSTNFATGGSNTEWSIELSTSEGTAMVPDYTGFFITNVNNQVRHFALNSSHNFGPYHDNNINNNGYNFCLDFFVQSEAPATETYTLEIAGYGNSDGGYYLIASPVAVDPTTVVDPTTQESMILTGNDAINYDLYYFDEAEEDEWRNYKTETFNLEPGKGYLYAHKRGGNFALVGVPYSGDGKVTLHKTDASYWEGWNLIGNPWGTAATIETEQGQEVSFYVMDNDGKSFVAGDNNVAPMQGIFVIAAIDEQEVTFVPAETPASGEGKLIVNLTASRSSVIDRAIVRFGQGTELPKFMFNPNSTKIYIPQNGEDFAVVRSAGEAEMPVNFKAVQNGTYTLSINPANVEMEYLHLVDNMTGTEIDLLETPSYTFEASTTDAANRFSLMYGVETGVSEGDVANFAYFNGCQWVVNNSGEATLQVVDAMGRVLSTKTINGNAEVSINQTAGVYMIRLINGNTLKTQKVVVR